MTVMPQMMRGDASASLLALLPTALCAAAFACAPVSAKADAPKSVMLPARPVETAAEVRLQPAPGCVAGQECTVGITADLKAVDPGDRRRLAVILDWPANLYQPTRPDGPWHCRPFSEEQLVCMAKIEEIANAQVSHLSLRLPLSGDPKLCATGLKSYDFGEEGQTRNVRLLQALSADMRREPRMPDGQMNADTRALLAGLAQSFSVSVDQDSVLVAALTGVTFNRQPVEISSCATLITPAPKPVESQGMAVAPLAPTAKPKAGATKDTGKEAGKPQDNFAVRNGPPGGPTGAEVMGPPPGPPGSQEGRPPPGSFEGRPPPPGTIIRGEPDAAILVRPWRIRPLQGLRRLFGD